MDEFSLGEQIAMGLAEKCARLEDERDQVIRERGDALAAADRSDQISLEVMRERDEWKADSERWKAENRSYADLAETRKRERDEAQRDHLKVCEQLAETSITCSNALCERDDARAETRLIASREVELIRERDEAQAVARDLYPDALGNTSAYINPLLLKKYPWLTEGEQ